MGLLDADLRMKTIIDVPLEKLSELGIDSLIIDVDNTVTEWKGRNVEARAKEWFLSIKEKGFKACLVSNNNSGERIASIAGQLGIPSIHRAGKPRRNAFIRALKILKSKPENTAVIGDQVFTDVFGGNRMGMYTVLVDPISSKEFFGTKLMRLLEKLVLRNKKRSRSSDERN